VLVQDGCQVTDPHAFKGGRAGYLGLCRRRCCRETVLLTSRVPAQLQDTTPWFFYFKTNK
jgi:hypothetical protein